MRFSNPSQQRVAASIHAQRCSGKPRSNINFEFYNPEGERVESDVWLNEKNAPRWELTQSAIHMPYYDQTLVLVSAERSGERELIEEPDPTPPSLPSFR